MSRVYVRNLFFGVPKWHLQKLLVDYCGLDENVPIQVIRKPAGREIRACSMIFTCPDENTMRHCVDVLNSLQPGEISHVLAPGQRALQANEAYIEGARKIPPKASAAPMAPPQPPTFPPPPHLLASSTAHAEETVWNPFDWKCCLLRLFFKFWKQRNFVWGYHATMEASPIHKKTWEGCDLRALQLESAHDIFSTWESVEYRALTFFKNLTHRSLMLSLLRSQWNQEVLIKLCFQFFFATIINIIMHIHLICSVQSQHHCQVFLSLKVYTRYETSIWKKLNMRFPFDFLDTLIPNCQKNEWPKKHKWFAVSFVRQDPHWILMNPRQLPLVLQRKAFSIFQNKLQDTKNKNVMYFSISCDRLFVDHWWFSGDARLDVYLQSSCFYRSTIIWSHAMKRWKGQNATGASSSSRIIPGTFIF